MVFKVKKVKKVGKKTSEKPGFYHELDHHTKRRHFSCATLLIVLLVLFFLGVWGANALIGKIFQRMKPSQPAVSSQAIQRAREKLKEFVLPLLGKNSQSALEVPLELEISSEELNLLLASSGQAGSNTSPLASIKVDITPQAIDFHKTLETALPANFDAKVSALPVIEKGKLTLKITDTRLGKVKLPAFLARSITKAISKPLEEALNKDGLEYTSASLKEGKLILRSKVKK